MYLCAITGKPLCKINRNQNLGKLHDQIQKQAFKPGVSEVQQHFANASETQSAPILTAAMSYLNARHENTGGSTFLHGDESQYLCSITGHPLRKVIRNQNFGKLQDPNTSQNEPSTSSKAANIKLDAVGGASFLNGKEAQYRCAITEHPLCKINKLDNIRQFQDHTTSQTKPAATSKATKINPDTIHKNVSGSSFLYGEECQYNCAITGHPLRKLIRY